MQIKKYDNFISFRVKSVRTEKKLDKKMELNPSCCERIDD